jgi:hypothetical protein
MKNLNLGIKKIQLFGNISDVLRFVAVLASSLILQEPLGLV